MRTTQIRRVLVIAACWITVTAAVGHAHGAFLTFGSRVAFNAAVDGNPGLAKTVQTFDTLADGTVIPNGTTVGGVTYTSSTGNSVVTNAFFELSPPNGLGRTPIEFFGGADTLTLAFPDQILAFGISINTFATAVGAYSLTTNLGDVALSAFDPFPGLATGQFVGFITDVPVSSLVLAAPGDFSYTLDDLTTARATPEPATFMLAAVGGIIGVARWRRRRKTA
jgi:PEP-CTERM motif